MQSAEEGYSTPSSMVCCCQCFPVAEVLLCFAFQVQCLERQNQALMTKWELLQQQSSRPEESRSITSFFQSYINNLQRQLDMLQSQKEQLDPEAYEMLQLVEDYKKRWIVTKPGQGLLQSWSFPRQWYHALGWHGFLVFTHAVDLTALICDRLIWGFWSWS